MTWMKLDTLVRSNPKLGATVAATKHCDAAWLWLTANTYCRDSLTDGFIADFVLPTLIPALPAKVLKTLPDVLIQCGLWHRAEGGYQVHDFLDHNPTKAEVEKAREKDRDRKRQAEGDAADSARPPSGIPTDSTRNPNGVRVDSTRIPDGVHAASELSRAGAPMRASSPSSSGSLEVLEPEGGPGETVPVVVGRESVADRAQALGLVRPGQWERQHASHALRGDLCGWVCLPQALHAEFINRVVGGGATLAEATASVRAWAIGVRDRWQASGPIPGEDNFVFWRAEWAAAHPSHRPSKAPGSGGGLDRLMGKAHG